MGILNIIIQNDIILLKNKIIIEISMRIYYKPAILYFTNDLGTLFTLLYTTEETKKKNEK